MDELAIIATLEVEPGTREALLPILLRHRERCLDEEPGTIAFEVLVPRTEPDRIMLYERYTNRAAFDTHWSGTSIAIAKEEAGARLQKITGIFCTPAGARKAAP